MNFTARSSPFLEEFVEKNHYLYLKKNNPKTPTNQTTNPAACHGCPIQTKLEHNSQQDRARCQKAHFQNSLRPTVPEQPNAGKREAVRRVLKRLRRVWERHWNCQLHQGDMNPHLHFSTKILDFGFIFISK